MSSGSERKFLNDHMAYLMSGDIDGMVRDQYTADAVMTSPLKVLDAPAPYALTTPEEIANYFKAWAAFHGSDIQFEGDVEGYVETDDSIVFQFVYRSQRGRWFEGLGWYMEGGKIKRQYGFAYRLGD